MNCTVNSLSDEFVKCRSWGHEWDTFQPIRRMKLERSTLLSLRCERCGCERHDVISNASGEVTNRTYNYPDGYALVGGKITGADMRLEVLRRERPVAVRRTPRNAKRLRVVS